MTLKSPVGTAHVDHDEQQAHGHRGHRQEFSQDGDPAEGLIIVQVVRQNHHHRRGRHADQVGELGDIKAPGDVPAQAGDASSRFMNCLRIEDGAYSHQSPAAIGQQSVVPFGSVQGIFEHGYLTRYSKPAGSSRDAVYVGW